MYIEQFIEWDKKNSFFENGILFVGSSSIRLWPTNQYFNFNIINLGFGGAHFSDINYYFDLIVSKYNPKIILLYAGYNDIAAKKSLKRCLVDYKKFVKLVEEKIPGCSIIFTPIKPSPARWKYWNNMIEADNLINQYMQQQNDQYCVDIVTPILNERGDLNRVFLLVIVYI